MKIIKEILGRVFALWAIILFIGTLIIVLIPTAITSFYEEPTRTSRFVSISRIWMRVYLFLIACPVEVKGTGHFRKDENYIVLCNHNSFMDIPLSFPAIPGANKTIAKQELARIPLFGYIYKKGTILVNRNNEGSRRKSFEAMKQILQMGMHMCIYPEGTRNKTTAPLQPFYSGAFKLAADTGKPIIPALIFNTRQVLPPGKFFYLWPGRLHIHFMSPVYIQPQDTPQNLKQELFARMAAYYVITHSILREGLTVQPHQADIAL